MPETSDRFSSPELTGGAGFAFEDEVVGFFIVCMLAGAGMTGAAGEPDGHIVRIACQLANREWHPDDVLLTLHDGLGERRCAVSLKSFPVLTARGLVGGRSGGDAPGAEFLREAWELYLGRCRVTPAFDAERDLVSIIGQGIPAGHYQNWCVIAQRVSHQDPVEVGESGLDKEQQAMFGGFSCPEAICSDVAGDGEATARFLKCVRIFDFAELGRLTLRMCQELLLSGSQAEAQSLQETCCTLAREYRPRGGVTDLPTVLSHLRGRFRLKPYPDYRADLERLEAISAFLMDEIDGTIAGCSISRESELADVAKAFSKGDARVVALVGVSGSGKSVVAERWAVSQREHGRVIWWDNATLAGAGAQALENAIGLQHALGDVLQNVPESPAYLIIDGVDRVFQEAEWQNLHRVLRALALGDEGSAWRVILTCETDAWERAGTRLASICSATRLHTVPVEPPTFDAVREIIEVVPALRPLARNDRMQGFILRPKILALVAGLAQAGHTPTGGIAETDVIIWLWEQLVTRNRMARSGAACALGTLQADELQQLVPIDAFNGEQQELIDTLKQEQVCAVREHRYGFKHDLFGDWARLHVLIQHQDELPAFIGPRCSSPLWQRALRLYGMYLLESRHHVEDWQTVFDALAEEGEGLSACQRLMMDALFMSSACREWVTGLWPMLTADGASLLSELLQRFVTVGTLPDDELIALLHPAQEEVGTELRGFMRRPNWPIWGRLLPVLLEHQDDLIAHVPGGVAAICRLWLRCTDTGFPYRPELATLILATATEVAAQVDTRAGWRHSLRTQDVYRAAMMAANELPDEVAHFALQRARRTGVPQELVEKNVVDPIARVAVAVPPPWPDGPQVRVDQDFHDVCLEDGLLVCLMRVRPEVAGEVLLALLIPPPEPESVYYSDLHEEAPLNTVYRWHPPSPTVGAFYTFVSTAPAAAIEAIGKLIDYCTERCIEYHARHGYVSVEAPIPIPEWGTWAGGSRCLFWSRDEFGAPEVNCALMSLEKWLYDMLDAEEGVADWIDRIAGSCNSTAIAGVFVSVACREPALLAGALRPLLSVPHFLLWDEEHRFVPNSSLMFLHIDELRIGQQRADEVREWYALPHRSTTLVDESVRLMLQDPEFAAALSEQVDRWMEQATEEEDPPLALRMLAAHLQVKNYATWQQDDGTHAAQCVVAAELQQEASDLAEGASRHLVISMLPTQCDRLLREGDTLDAEAAERIWAQLSVLLLDPAYMTEDTGPIRFPDAVCAAAAALLCLGGEWFSGHAEAQTQCRQVIIAASGHPVTKRFEPFESFDYTWDSFCARALPVLWAEDPGNRDLLMGVCLLALSPHPWSVAHLLIGAFRWRHVLGDEFGRLRHLVLLASRAQHLASEAARQDECWRNLWRNRSVVQRCRRLIQKLTRFNMRRWGKDMLRLFVRRRLSGTVPPLNDIADGLHAGAGRRGTRRRRDRGLDPYWVQAAHDWLPVDLRMAQSAQERAEWLRLWEELLAFVVGPLHGAEVPEDDTDIDGLPNDFDRWVFTRVATALLSLRDRAERQRLWQPILDLRTPAHHWIESFLSTFLSRRHLVEEPRGEFLTAWREMVEYALAAPTWTRPGDGEARYVADMWEHLLGMDGWTLLYGEDADLIADMEDLYHAWAVDHLTTWSAARAFVRFLRSAAARRIRLRGLVLLAEAQIGGFVRDRVQDDLAAILGKSWGEDSERILADSRTKAACLSLLALLPNNPVALQILDEMGGGGLVR